jgi:hypothetical protein
MLGEDGKAHGLEVSGEDCAKRIEDCLRQDRIEI